MAVKPITNKHVTTTSQVDRSSQKSFKSNPTKGNRSQSVNPGKDYTKNYSITLKDIDTTVMGHIKNIMKPTVRESNETIESYLRDAGFKLCLVSPELHGFQKEDITNMKNKIQGFSIEAVCTKYPELWT